MKPIVVFTDFSATAQKAVDAARQMAAQYKSEIYLIHIAHHGVDISDVDAELRLIDCISSPTLKPYARGHRLIHTDNFVNINNVLESLNAGIVFIGSKGYNKTSELFFGSTTQRIVSNVRIPVVVIKDKVEEFKLDTLVFASKFYIEDEKGFTRIMDIVREAGSNVHLLKIITKSHFELSSVTYKNMDAFARSIGLENYSKNIYNHEHVEEGIIEYIRHQDADALVIGVKENKTTFSQMIFGTDINDITNHVKRPVISVLIPHVARKTTRILFPE